VSARESRPVTLALRYMQRTGCKPLDAAARYGVATSSIFRAMHRAGMAVKPRGRPKTVKPDLL
jgi:hypothetical protein